MRITLPEDNKQILAACYQHYLPTEEELRAEVTRSREEVERRMRLESGEPSREAPGQSKPRKRGSLSSSRHKR